MPIPSTYPLTAMRGDSVGHQIVLWKDAQHTVPVVLTGAVVTAQLRVTDTDSKPVATWTVTTVGNAVTITLSPSQTTALPESTVWDIQVDWSGDQTTVTTVHRGTLKLTQDVTRA